MFSKEQKLYDDSRSEMSVRNCSRLVMLALTRYSRNFMNSIAISEDVFASGWAV